MTTLSVPISGDLEKFIERMIQEGKGANKADVVRRAIRQMSDDEAVRTILQAQSEPTLRGDLRELMKKFK